jgi:hypothetical protein
VTQVGQCCADQRDGPGQVGGDDVLDLVVGQFLGGAEQAVAGVADDGVDPAELAEGAVDELPDGGMVGHLQYLRDERVRVAIGEVGDFRGVADGADHAVATVEQPAGKFAAESAADAGDEPGAHCHAVRGRDLVEGSQGVEGAGVADERDEHGEDRYESARYRGRHLV